MNKRYNFCMNCGYKLDIDDVYCTNCGVKAGEITKRPEHHYQNNDFCKNCGYRLEDDDVFCPECGTRTGVEVEVPVVEEKIFEEEKLKILELNRQYMDKNKKALELIVKNFGEHGLTYAHFEASLKNLTDTFTEQVEVSLRIIDLASDESETLKKELDNKLKTLNSLFKSQEKLIEELIIHLASNKEEDDEIRNLMGDMESLIKSIRDYQ